MSTAVQGQLCYYYKDPYRKIPIFITGKKPVDKVPVPTKSNSTALVDTSTNPFSNQPVTEQTVVRRCVVWIGGQSETFFTINYFHLLAEKLEGHWNFAQVELASSHIGYGAQDHFKDAEDLDDIIGMLTQEYDMDEITLFTTSTGFQVALRELEAGRNASYISRAIFHGIVASPESLFFSEKITQLRATRLQELISTNRKDDVDGLVGLYDIPITPARLAGGGFPTLQEALWLPALRNDLETAKNALQCVQVPTLVMIAHDSQYHPSKEDLATVEKTLKDSIGTEELSIAYFNDSCDELRRLLKAAQKEHVDAIVNFLNSADRKRKEREEDEKKRAIEIEKAKRFSLQQMMTSQ